MRLPAAAHAVATIKAEAIIGRFPRELENTVDQVMDAPKKPIARSPARDVLVDVMRRKGLGIRLRYVPVSGLCAQRWCITGVGEGIVAVGWFRGRRGTVKGNVRYGSR